MADHRAIQAVSAALRDLLMDGIDNAKKEFVTIGLPSSNATTGSTEARRVNLFLYRVTPAPVLGEGSPRRTLDLQLHYLLTAFGHASEGDMDRGAHTILGEAMQTFLATPILSRELICRQTGAPLLSDILADEFEKIRISPEFLSLEDLSKVWTALSLPMRISVGYLVSLVQIEPRTPAPMPRRVGQPLQAPGAPGQATGPFIWAAPRERPSLEEAGVEAAGRLWPYVAPGDTLFLRGRKLDQAASHVELGDLRLVPITLSGTELSIQIPDDATAPWPGLVGVRVHQIEGASGISLTSNAVPLMLVPFVKTAKLDADERTLTIEGRRLLRPGQPGATSIGRSLVLREAYRSASTEDSLLVPLPPRVQRPFRRGILGGVVTELPLVDKPPPPDLEFHVAGQPDVTVKLDTPMRLGATSDVHEFARELTARLRDATGMSVLVCRGKLVFVHPSRLAVPSLAQPPPAGEWSLTTTDGRLKLGATDRKVVVARTSSALTAPLSLPTPAVLRAHVGASSQDVAFSVRSPTPRALADALHTALFATLGVAVDLHDERLVLVREGTTAIRLEDVGQSGVLDALGLGARVPVHVRVGDGESVADVTFTLAEPK